LSALLQKKSNNAAKIIWHSITETRAYARGYRTFTPLGFSVIVKFIINIILEKLTNMKS